MIYELHKGDSRDILPDLIKKGMQVDSIVTDPPYHLTGKTNKEKGFMGKKWDGGDIAQDPEFWKLCYQILKPGGYLLSFSSTRTYHRMTCAIEDAGFEIRDQIGWLYGNGFPKSHNIAKAIDKHLGKEGIVTGTRSHPTLKDKSKIDRQNNQQFHGTNTIKDEWEIVSPESPEAQSWNGWGTALKPAWEPICVARKPLEEGLTVAENVLKYGTGGINIDGCRVPIDKDADAGQLRTMKRSKREEDTSGQAWGMSKNQDTQPQVVREDGRFPANIIHDGSEEVLNEFAKYGERTSGHLKEGFHIKESQNRSMSGKNQERLSNEFKASSGSASRFFYSAKASNEDRAGSNHPTVKPISLISYLCKLVTPPKGIILDPFAGSGTMGQAAVENGFYPILIEMTPEYQNDIETRMKKLESDAFYTVFE